MSEPSSERLRSVAADGGGDTPEDVDAGLHDAVGKVAWRGDDAVKLILLVGDAAPHLDYTDAASDYVVDAVEAARRGIKVHALAASGLDDQGEYVFRQIAQATEGRFVFLTYGADGGPGDSTTHHVAGYTPEALDDLVVSLVSDELAPCRTAGMILVASWAGAAECRVGLGDLVGEVLDRGDATDEDVAQGLAEAEGSSSRCHGGRDGMVGRLGHRVDDGHGFCRPLAVGRHGCTVRVLLGVPLGEGLIRWYSGVPTILFILLAVRRALRRAKYSTPVAGQAWSTPSRISTTRMACFPVNGAFRKMASEWNVSGCRPKPSGALSTTVRS